MKDTCLKEHLSIRGEHGRLGDHREHLGCFIVLQKIEEVAELSSLSLNACPHYIVELFFAVENWKNVLLDILHLRRESRFRHFVDMLVHITLLQLLHLVRLMAAVVSMAPPSLGRWLLRSLGFPIFKPVGDTKELLDELLDLLGPGSLAEC